MPEIIPLALRGAQVSAPLHCFLVRALSRQPLIPRRKHSKLTQLLPTDLLWHPHPWSLRPSCCLSALRRRTLSDQL